MAHDATHRVRCQSVYGQRESRPAARIDTAGPELPDKGEPRRLAQGSAFRPSNEGKKVGPNGAQDERPRHDGASGEAEVRTSPRAARSGREDADLDRDGPRRGESISAAWC